MPMNAHVSGPILQSNHRQSLRRDPVNTLQSYGATQDQISPNPSPVVLLHRRNTGIAIAYE